MDQLLYQAVQLHQSGRLEEAERLYLQLAAQMPGDPRLLHMLGLLRYQQGRHEEALAHADAALRIQPNATETLSNRALSLVALGRLREAIAAFDQVVALAPGQFNGWNNRGTALMKDGRPQEGLASFERAVAVKPDFAAAWTNCGMALRALGRSEGAVAAFGRAVALDPGKLKPYNERGLALRDLKRFTEAAADFTRALERGPGHAGVLNNRGTVYWEMDRVDEAKADFDRAILAKPDFADALGNRAQMMWGERGELVASIADLEAAMRHDPGIDFVPGYLMHLKMHAADWRDFEKSRMALDQAVRAGGLVAEPFVYQGISDVPADLLACARSYAAAEFPERPAQFAAARAEGKIRLGYVCGEFKRHATPYLAAGLFENHDRNRFEVTAFDNGASDNSAMRTRLESAFGEIVGVAGRSAAEAARAVAERKIDILVNLNGYYGKMRMELFALRPAPLQVNYLGFPGTLGAAYIDYIIADRQVIPPGEEQFYVEKVVRLPHSYQPNDNKRPIGEETTRQAHGLAGDAFVFCHFNFGWKLTPATFDGWMRILSRVPGSLLWLLESSNLFAGNLRREAAARGIDPARLVFAPQIPMERHLARLKLGDLFLDSLPYGAHTTASDALWAGLPLVTQRGTAFAGRVGASLLTAIGLTELIAESAEDFENLAVALARDRTRLTALRKKLAENRATAPLFDTALYARHLESAFTTMQARRGGPPAGFDVAP